MVRAHSVDEVRRAIEMVERRVGEGLVAAGYIGYEAAPAFDPALNVRTGSRMPLVWFGIYDPPERSPAPSGNPSEADPSGPWELEVPRERFDEAIARIQAAIADGETYQVNYTARMRAPFTGSPQGLYERLRRAQGRGYHALLDLDRYSVVSASPELFFHMEDCTVTTRPMKGTRPRGRWPEEDRLLARELRRSEKDRAENRMIVDLVRNDLGRVARVGSVRVPRTFEIERYRTVLQMTSTVRARVAKGRGFGDVLAALFPCGSVTGAPKVRTMSLISELETSTRDVYCGAIGIVDGARGTATFSVPIRTVWVDHETDVATYGVGSGVTWDSTADGEHEEIRAKARVLSERWPDFDLLETLRLEQGVLVRLERHLDRLRASARYFDIAFPGDEIRTALDTLQRRYSGDPRRVRLLLAPDGDLTVEDGPLPNTGRPAARDGSCEAGAGEGTTGSLPVVRLAREPVDLADRFLYHKTTHRDVYERHRAAHPEAFDILLWNSRRELTEFTVGNLVVERSGRLVTPPRDAGLLAGCFRAELLERGRVSEEPIRIRDLAGTDRMWLVNSVREWVEVRLDSGDEPA